jgi:hypothetical protein
VIAIILKKAASSSTSLSHHTTNQLTEIGFLLILITGIWLAASEIPALRIQRARNVVAGIALAVAGLLLIIAAHWGKLG